MILETATLKPKVLILTTNPCYPLTHGGAIGQYYIIDGLKEKVDFVLCTIVNSKRELEDLKQFMRNQPLVKVYFIDNSAGEIRSIIKDSIKNIIKFPFRLLKRLLKKDKNKELLHDDFLNDSFCSINANINSDYICLVDTIIKQEHINKVQLDFFNMMPFVFILPKEVKKIFICHELAYKRLELGVSNSRLSDMYKKFLIERMRFYEESLIQKMDAVVVLNDDDKNRLSGFTKNIVCTPFAIPNELIYKYEASIFFTSLVFAAGEGHTPNALGLAWFLDTIYIPHIDSIPYKIIVIGKWSNKYKRKYKTFKKIVFTGVVPSIKPYFENAILINPILTGAGIRMKVLHAMANKVPVFTTRFGAEGLYTEGDSHFAFLDTSEEFMNIIRTYNNDTLHALALAGNNYYNTFFNKEKLLQKRLEVYKGETF